MKLIKKIICIILSLSFLFIFSSCSEKKYTDTRALLDTVVTITAYGDDAENAVREAMEYVTKEEMLLSSHIETSDISRINASKTEEEVEVDKETADIIKRSLEMCKKTDGAFDITVKPIIDLWNIKSENPSVPSDEKIKSALEYVGYENITVSGNIVIKKKDGIKIDLGASAKGYMADKVKDILKSHSVKNALIDLGGNIYAMGKNESGVNWKIGLQDPGKDRGEYFTVENLSDKSAVTSGSYERYFEKDGKIYHHIMDPKTGRPADSDYISVTVVSENSFEADVLSTAIFVMGKEKFENIKDRFNFEKYITVDKNNKKDEGKK